jgi:inosine/xanthosine triphosphatase
MRVAVGSPNPVKRRATERAIGDVASVVAAEPVPSGVSEQPLSEAETIAGAANRAERALEAGEYDIGVGIEGGVAPVESLEGRYLTMWAAATDGETVGRGAGPRLRLPDHVTARLDDGEELGPVMADILGREGIAEEEGAAGALTNMIITRESSLRHAVAGALGPFVTSQYDR